MTDRSATASWATLAGLAALVGAGVLGLISLGLWMTAAGGSADDAAGPDVADDGFAVWAVNDDGEPVRWDPCEPVEFVLSAEGWPTGTREDLRAALDMLSDASGLDLEVVGETDERPSGSRLPYQPEQYGERWAPVLVGWASPHAHGLPLRDVDRGLAVPVAVGGRGDRSFVSGQVVFNVDRDDQVAGGGDRATSWQATMLHELAHVLGLDHVDDPDAIMHTYPVPGPVELDAGDRDGLRAVGADAGCRPAPDPQPVEVPPLDAAGS